MLRVDATRRQLLRLAAVAVTLPGAADFLAPWLRAQTHDQHYAPPDPGLLKDYQPRFFAADDFAALEAFTAILIPTDDTPGAREARCAHFLDFLLQSSEKVDANLARRWRTAVTPASTPPTRKGARRWSPRWRGPSASAARRIRPTLPIA
jgi:hypothetical protein